jgi:hypothetical protein
MVHIREKVRQRKLKERYVGFVLGKIIRACETCKRAEPVKRMAREGKNLREIGEVLRFSRQRVHQQLSRFAFPEDIQEGRMKAPKRKTPKRKKKEKKPLTPEQKEQKRLEATERTWESNKRKKEAGYKFIHIWILESTMEQLKWLIKEAKKRPVRQFDSKLKGYLIHSQRYVGYATVISQAIDIYYKIRMKEN